MVFVFMLDAFWKGNLFFCSVFVTFRFAIFGDICQKVTFLRPWFELRPDAKIPKCS